MLLNEFLRERRKAEAQERKVRELMEALVQLRAAVTQEKELHATVAKLQSVLERQAEQVQKVSERVEGNRAAARLAVKIKFSRSHSKSWNTGRIR